MRPSVLDQRVRRRFVTTSTQVGKRRQSEATCNHISHDMISSLHTYMAHVPQYSSSRALP